MPKENKDNNKKKNKKENKDKDVVIHIDRSLFDKVLSYSDTSLNILKN